VRGRRRALILYEAGAKSPTRTAHRDVIESRHPIELSTSAAAFSGQIISRSDQLQSTSDFY